MSLWYDIKKKSYAYDAKESWLRSYADKIVSALKEELLEKLGEHFEGKFGPHNADDVNCSSGESVQTALDLEAEERTSGDDFVKSLVTAEEEARMAGDNDVKALVTQEENARIAGDNEVKALVTQEKNARMAGDNEVKALVTAEEEARIAGDNEIKDLIVAEKNARTSALALKVDKVSGKALSTNDYTNADKQKLSGIESGAQVNSVTSVAGKTGAVTLAKSDVGLNNVDNTADLDKPVSTATSNALKNKANTSDVLTKNNTSAFTPSGSYNPATKKYVDEQIAGAVSSGTIDLSAYLAKDNIDEFTPTGDYNPATKKYVDERSIENLITGNEGVALGYASSATYGVSVGAYAQSSGYGSAVGYNSVASGYGGALGYGANAASGGAVGKDAKTGNGFAGGSGAKTVNGTSAIDAIQLGGGTNSNAKTLQIYNYQLLDANGNIPKDRLKNTIGMTPPTLTAVTQSDTSVSSASWTGTGYFCKGSGKYVANPDSAPSIDGYYRFCLRPASASDKECMMWTPYYTYNGYRHEFFYSPSRRLYEALIPPTDATAQEIVNSIVWEFTPPTIIKYGKLSNAINYTVKEDGETMDKFSFNPEMYIRDSSGRLTQDDKRVCAFIGASWITFPDDLDTNLCALLHLISDVEAEGCCDMMSAIKINQVVLCTVNGLTIDTIDSFNA